MGCDAEDRRAIESWICEFYYDQLTKYMGKKPNFNVEKVILLFSQKILKMTQNFFSFRKSRYSPSSKIPLRSRDRPRIRE